MTKPSEDSSANRFVCLDGLRGVAALAVVASHVPLLFGYDFPNVDLAVDFFFALSGFVLAHAYGDRLKSGLTAKRFMLLRLIRLYPLYILGTAIGWASFAAGLTPVDLAIPSGWTPLAALLSILMTPIFVGAVNFPFNGPAWSLFFEMIANGAFAVLHRQLGKPLVILAGLGVFGVLLALAIHRFGSVSLGWQTDWTALSGLARVGYSFIAGLGVYALHRRRPLRLGFRPWGLALLLLALVVMPTGGHHGAYQLACILILLPLVLYVGAGLSPGRREGVAFTLLGGLSYAVYATHYPLATALQAWLQQGPALAAVWTPWAGFAFVAFAALLGYAADRWFDHPVRRVLTRWERNRSRAAVTA